MIAWIKRKMTLRLLRDELARVSAERTLSLAGGDYRAAARMRRRMDEIEADVRKVEAGQ